jgi:cytochrome c553
MHSGLLALIAAAAMLPALAQQGDAKRGEYFAKAGGCVGCHTEEKKDAVRFAGGRALKTPFGTFYGPNITTHPGAGIGRWTETDFVRAMRQGVRPDGANYFPAFPYPSYTKISDADLRDLWAYLRTVPPDPRASKPHDLGFLYRWRSSLRMEVALLQARLAAADPKARRPSTAGVSPQALGHCGEATRLNFWRSQARPLLGRQGVGGQGHPNSPRPG